MHKTQNRKFQHWVSCIKTDFSTWYSSKTRQENLNKHDNALIPMKGIAWYNTHLSTAENKNFYNHAITKTRSIMQFKRFGCEFLSLKRALTEPPPKPICKNTYIPLNVSHKMPKVLPLRCPSLYSHTHNLRPKGKC